MKRQLIIIGAGGHGRVAADIASLCGYTDIEFLDDADVIGVRLLGKLSDFSAYIDTADFFVAIGDNCIRQKVMIKLCEAKAKIVTLVHPRAVVADGVMLGKGTVVMAGAVINTGSTVGSGVIINTCSSVDHDCVIEDFAHISVGAHLAGTVHTGARTFICAGATVINNITVCADCVIGAGAVVVKNIDKAGTYKGVPAHL